MSTDANKSQLQQPVSKWSFEFWKQQVEEAIDIPSAVGRLNACTNLDSTKYGESIILYLMEVGTVVHRSSYRHEDSRDEVLALQACRCLARALNIRYPGWSEMKYVPPAIIEKALWFFGPVEFRGKPIDPLSGIDETSKSLRRFRGQLCWALWKGDNRHSNREHKVKVLKIFYSIGRLSELAPAPRYEHHSWDDFEDVLPEIDALAQTELAQLSKDYGVQSIAEAAYWEAPACRLLLLVRPILMGRTAWIERRGDSYLGPRVNVTA